MKLIKKVSQAIAVIGKVLNSKSKSTQDTYSCDYINNELDKKTNTNTLIVKNDLPTNLGVGWYANQLNYSIVGNVAFCHLILNTKTASTSTEEFYVELPFKIKSNWYQPLIKASKDNNYYLLPINNSNKLRLTNTSNRTNLTCNAIGYNYLIDTEFFVFITTD